MGWAETDPMQFDIHCPGSLVYRDRRSPQYLMLDRFLHFHMDCGDRNLSFQAHNGHLCDIADRDIGSYSPLECTELPLHMGLGSHKGLTSDDRLILQSFQGTDRSSPLQT